jgi:hypothetical protein
MKVLSRSRRDSIAATFAALAIASLGLVVVAAVVSMRGEFRTALAAAALCGYAYFARRAMELWQGRGLPALRRSVWRRHFLYEKSDGPIRPPKPEVVEGKRLKA